MEFSIIIQKKSRKSRKMRNCEIFLIGVLEKLRVARQDGDNRQVNLCLGSLRGFVHAMGKFKMITRVCEFRLCAVPFDELGFNESLFLLKKYLDKGNSDQQDGYFTRTDYAISVVEGGEP